MSHKILWTVVVVEAVFIFIIWVGGNENAKFLHQCIDELQQRVTTLENVTGVSAENASK